jgi:hypothetical protein
MGCGGWSDHKSQVGALRQQSNVPSTVDTALCRCMELLSIL